MTYITLYTCELYHIATCRSLFTVTTAPSSHFTAGYFSYRPLHLRTHAVQTAYLPSQSSVKLTDFSQGKFHESFLQSQLSTSPTVTLNQANLVLGSFNWQVSTVGWHLLFRFDTHYRLHPRDLLQYSCLSLPNYKCIFNFPQTDGTPKRFAPARSHLAKLTIKKHFVPLPTGTSSTVSLSPVPLRHTSCTAPANLTVDMFCPDSCCLTP